MWIVRIALRQPISIIVMVVLILLSGVRSAVETPTDMFPNIGIPVVAVVWTYNGLLPDEMSDRIVYYFERMVTVQVNNIQSLQSESVIGYGVIKIFFQPSVNVNAAVAQVTAAAQTVLKFLPGGTTPPYVLAYNASTVPIIQLALSGTGISQFKLFDLGNNFIRPQLASVAGAAVPIPYGGLNRSIQADLNLQAMQANGVSPQDVTAALMAQNLIIPAGTEKIGRFEWHIRLNSSPIAIDEINDMPIKKVNGTVIYMRDIAFVHDGAPPQTNLVRVDGSRAVLMPVFKSGDTSTLDIVAGVRHMLPIIKEAMPKSLRIIPLGDQSVFVKDAVSGVVREATIAALLTGLMVSSVPRQLAPDGHYRDDNSVGGAVLDRGTVSNRANHQRHDAWRTGAGGRHARRCSHGNAGKHQLSPGAGQGRRHGDPGRRTTDRRAVAGLAAGHLHRVRAHVHTHRRLAFSVHADGRVGDLRAAGVVRALGLVRAHDGKLPAPRAASRWRPARRRAAALAQPAGAVPARLRSRLQSYARGLSVAARTCAGAAGAVHHGLPCLRGGLAGSAGAVARQ